jgi:peptide-methionine (S)-S-oxide reductase
MSTTNHGRSPLSHRIILVVAIALSLGYVWLRGGFIGLSFSGAAAQEQTAKQPPGLQKATFAGGCFWCTEADFEKVPGVVSAVSGYIGGRVANPTYEQVSSGSTGHTEAVEIMFDPAVVSYERLLDHFWRNVDPFTAERQFCDVGRQYRPEIFVHSGEQRAAATASKTQVQRRFREPIVVAVTDAGPFYRAEAYHQDFYKNHSVKYRFYRWNCGRDARLEAIWGS